MNIFSSTQSDPRTMLDSEALAELNQRALPNLPRASTYSPGFLLGLAGIGLLGVMTFATLSRERIAPKPAAPVAAPVTPPPVQMAPPAPMPTPVPLVPGPPQVPPPVLVQPTPPASAQNAEAAAAAAAERLKSPAIVVDLTKVAAANAPVDAKPGDRPGDGVSAEDRFADRVAQAENRPARAVRINGTTDIVPQGAIIAGVLETAINSDLPGYVRAVVSRDVAGFDGRKILIPRGSRLIGQYRSGLAAGQSRAFIIWSRLMRPDGVSIQLGSPATDQLGRAGLAGSVNSHFLKRFGSAILLSVVQAGLASLQRTANTIVVQSAQDAQNVASVALSRDINIPPTIKVPQGSPIRIFTARDLDFSLADQ